MKSPFFSIALLLCLATCGARADDLPPLRGFLITTEQIPSSGAFRISAVARDTQGFVWFGTPVGLCKYDGYTLHHLPVGPRGTAGSGRDDRNVVRAMIRLRDGSFLLATNGGPWILDPRSEESAPLLQSGVLADSRISAVAEDRSGNVWFGAGGAGLYRYRRGGDRSLRLYTTLDGLTDTHISSLLVGRSGELWIGTVEGGLHVLDPGASRIRPYRPQSGAAFRSGHIASLCENQGRELWIGTDEGLYLLDLSSDRLRVIDLRSRSRHTVSSITSDPAGRVWIAAQELGLLSYAGGELTRFTPRKDEERALNSLTDIYLDTAASTGARLLLWTGARGGASKIVVSPERFSNFIRNQNNLQLDRGAVLSICEDHTGMLWTGLWGGGLNGFRRAAGGGYLRIARFEAGPDDPRGLPHNDVNALLEDAGGNLWIGTPGGLAMLDAARKHLTVFRHRDGDARTVAGTTIERIVRDRDGNLWICSTGGLSKLVPGPSPSFTTVLDSPAQAHPAGGNAVTDLVQDVHGGCWAATYGKGLMKLEADGRWTQVRCPGDSAGMNENWIAGLTAARSGGLWLITRVGLVSYDPVSGAFERRDVAQLANAHIFDAFEDHNGDLWLSTSVGLARYSPKTGYFMRFENDDGFPFEELFSGFAASSRGTLLVGGIDGFSEFSPAAAEIPSRAPAIAVTEFSVFDRPLPPPAVTAGEIRLAHDENFFSLSFAALDYVHPQRNRFSYRMEGVDEQWIDAGSRNYVRYTHLDPGRYVFRVRGCNSDNVWNEAGAAVMITIAPPYWQSAWFRLLLIALVGGAAYAGYRYRLQRVIAVERMRLRIADDLHDDVGSNLSAIAMASRSFQHAPSLDVTTRRKLAEIYETAVATSEGLKDVVWFIKPRNDTLDDLILRMKDTAAFLLADLAVEFQAPESDRSARITIDFKRHFFLAFKESLTNIVKHAAATRVVVKVERRNGMLEAVISDNGRGFQVPPEGARRRGHGLTSLRGRARSMGGAFEVTSEPGKGTTVKFSGRL